MPVAADSFVIARLAPIFPTPSAPRQAFLAHSLFTLRAGVKIIIGYDRLATTAVPYIIVHMSHAARWGDAYNDMMRHKHLLPVFVTVGAPILTIQHTKACFLVSAHVLAAVFTVRICLTIIHESSSIATHYTSAQYRRCKISIVKHYALHIIRHRQTICQKKKLCPVKQSCGLCHPNMKSSR